MARSMIAPARRPGSLFAAALLVALASVLGACGTPEFTFVTNSKERVYFKVPHEWREVNAIDPIKFTLPVEPGSQEEADRDARRVWAVAYDSDDLDREPDVLFGNRGKPFIFAKVFVLDEEQRNSASLDTMRDALGLPVSQASREARAEHLRQVELAMQAGRLSPEQAASANSLRGFELLVDEVLSPGDGLKGVREIYNYKYGDGPVHTYDQTVLLSADSSRLYVFVISSAADYYREHFDELNEIATSFTVRS
jgi:hypothetical protein